MTKRFCLLTILTVSLSVVGAEAATTISWWQFWTDPVIKPVIRSIVSDFENQNPDIKIELTDLTWSNGHEKIVLAFASGNAPDVVELGSDWIAQFASNGKLHDLSPYTDSSSDSLMGWSMATYDGSIYARPWFLGTRVLFVNRDLMARAEYEPEFLPYNWDALTEAAIKISALSKDIYGWGSNTAEKHRLYKKYLPFFWSAGGQIFSDDGTICVLSSVQAVSALQAYKKLHDSCGYVADQRGIEDAFLDGRIGFVISGDWLLKRIELEKRSINFATTMIPGPKFPGKSFLGGEFLAISESSNNKDAARRLIEFITSSENQVRFCRANRTATPSSLAARQDEYFTSNEHLRMFNLQLQSSVHPPVDPDWVEIEDIIEKAVEEALFGGDLVAEPLRKARRKIQNLKDR